MIPIYQTERAVAGLAEKIEQQTTIAYLSPIFNIFPDIESHKVIAETINKLVVASENDSDLYRTKSILVSTNWNKNDDVFDKVECWNARNTPSHKPTNIGHDEHQLCGHITNTWAIDTEGKIIADNINLDDLPSLYHIVNGAVIYTAWNDEKLIERTQNLIAEIKDGKKFVSMECLFSDFDYAECDIDSDGKDFKVIAREEATAYLTKHLRAYGGTGQYNNKKIGRLLRNITFCGKGYVDKPANPNSVIFANWIYPEIEKAEKIIDLNSDSVYDNEKTRGEKMNPDELKELNDKLQASETKLVDAEKKSAELVDSNQKLVAKVTELEVVIAEKDKSIDELIKSKSELAEELNKVRANELKTNRISKLVDGGIEKETATKKVELFISLSDEQFNAVAEELINAAKAIRAAETKETKVDDTEGKCGKDKEKGKDDTEGKEEDTEGKTDEEKDCKGEDTVDATNLDNVQTEQTVDLTAASDVNDKELDDIRNELVQAIASAIGVQKKTKKS
jgi:hypothetical protein